MNISAFDVLATPSAMIILIVAGCSDADSTSAPGTITGRTSHPNDTGTDTSTAGGAPLSTIGGVVSTATTTESGDDSGDDSGGIPSSRAEPPPELGPWGSGTRLMARYEQSEGGSLRFLNVWDSELELECEFFETQAGWRCLPPQVLPLYGDADCEQPVATDVPTGDNACESSVQPGSTARLGLR